MTEPRRIYLDNAATSWPKPDAVYEAVDRYQRCLGAPAGRSAYTEASEVEHRIARTRQAIARLVGADDACRIVFTFNGTDALNMAILGLVRSGDHVVTTCVEHNSVLRPLRFLEETQQVSVTRVGCNGDGVVEPDELLRAVSAETRLVVVTHASNVTGAVQPIPAIGRGLKDHDALFLVDAAQSLGHIPVDVDSLGADLLAAPGHKGLLGPLGTGILYLGGGVEKRLQPLRFGGTGTESQVDRQPETLPDRYESGNHNVPGILGLGAGVEFLLSRGVDSAGRHEQRLTARLLQRLGAVSGVTVYGPPSAEARVAVVSLSVRGYDPQEMASILDAAYRIQVRSGLHCAPRMHEALGTTQQGGTVRLSLGPFTTEEDVDAAAAAIAELAAEH